MDKKKKEVVDYAVAYRQFMNFGHGRSLKQFCEDEDYDYGKLQRYSIDKSKEPKGNLITKAYLDIIGNDITVW